MLNKLLFIIFTVSLLIGCNKTQENTPTIFEGEQHLSNLRMLTHDGENAEAYFSPDEKRLIFQSSHGQYKCDQIFSMPLDGSNETLLSTGHGKTTCSYYFPDNTTYIYASTHGNDTLCPPAPDYSQGYVWPIYSSFELYVQSPGSPEPEVLSPAPGYDAEATISPKGDKIVFTSQRSGDLEIFTMNLDGSDLKQLTNELGYDGGPFFSWDGSKIVYRSYHPKTAEEIERYKSLLADELIEPGNFQLWVMDADGSNKKQVTNNKFANFGPFYHPDNNRIIFCSSLNSKNPRRPDFNLWMINEDGSNLKQITFYDGFDGFPMFTRDGSKLVFASNRNNHKPRDTNIFLADWKE
jgi:TolB protein